MDFRIKFLALAAGLAFAAMPALAMDNPLSGGTGLKPIRDKIDRQDYSGAIPLLTGYVKDHPNDPDGFNLMGLSLRKTGKPDLALQYYNRALTLMPNHLGANEYVGELYVELGQIDKAKERLAVLHAACGNCGEAQDLDLAIKTATAKR